MAIPATRRPNAAATACAQRASAQQNKPISIDEGELAGPLHEALLDSLALLEITDDVDETMRRLTKAARQLIDGCTMSGVSALDGDGIRTVGATDPAGDAIDGIQYETHEGPCWEAATEAAAAGLHPPTPRRTPVGRSLAAVPRTRPRSPACCRAGW